jgi:prepilin-type N-terminal cleavage/methylation domain-containing protein
MMRVRREEGFTITEVLVAILLLALGAMAAFSLLASATRNAQRAEASQVAIEFAEQELESLRSMESEELAMTTTPQPSSNPFSPNYRVSAGKFAVSREPVGDYGTLVVENTPIWGEERVVEGAAVSPGPTPFTSGEVTGKVYRYVVWRDDVACGAECPGPQDYKQIIVAVKLDTPPSQAAERGYVEVQSNFIDPTDSAEKDPAAGAEGKVVTAQQFYLTDTSCSAGGATVRAEITGEHLLHNTLGTCASGTQSGGTLGAPDALLLGSPPDPDPEDPTNPLLYDYANDTYLEPTPDTDRGLQIRLDDTSGCHYVPTDTTNPEARIHRWVTDPMAASFVMTNRVTLEFYTRTLNDALYKGTLCVFVFKRHETGAPPVATDTMLTNKFGGTSYWTYTPQDNEYWPRNAWTKVRLTMEFNGSPYTIPTGDRLGIALSAERSNTGAVAIPVVYDHPNYPTRIEVDTNTPIDGS